MHDEALRHFRRSTAWRRSYGLRTRGKVSTSPWWRELWWRAVHGPLSMLLLADLTRPCLAFCHLSVGIRLNLRFQNMRQYWNDIKWTWIIMMTKSSKTKEEIRTVMVSFFVMMTTRGHVDSLGVDNRPNVYIGESANLSFPAIHKVGNVDNFVQLLMQIN